ncbi:MAG: hypothetical protein GY861_21190 [bacterium]|nr:hypothetical protein [bacterium]
MPKDVYYINLSNGLEYYSVLKRNGVDVRFIRLPSTLIEKKAWKSFFLSVDSDMLMNAALGNNIHIYDCGCRREISKVIYFGIPLLRYSIERVWFNKTYTPNVEFINIFDEVFEYKDGCNIEQLGLLKNKYGYFCRYLNDSIQKVRLHGYSRATEFDGNNEHYCSILDIRMFMF